MQRDLRIQAKSGGAGKNHGIAAFDGTSYLSAKERLRAIDIYFCSGNME